MAHILVIDDEPDVRLATVMALKHGGHTTVEADGASCHALVAAAGAL